MMFMGRRRENAVGQIEIGRTSYQSGRLLREGPTGSSSDESGSQLERK